MNAAPQSAVDNLGPHLLGCRPSPPDARDYRLGDYLHLAAGAPSNLASALAALEADAHVARATKDWAAFVTPYLQQVPAPPPAPSRDVLWQSTEPVLDQGQFGTCEGNAWAQWGNTLPVDDRYSEADARAIYYEATKIDGAPDDPDAPGGGQQGATTRSGAKAMQARGRLDAYAFAASVDEIRTWLVGKGPVVMGTEWDESMFKPEPSGFVVPDGNSAGRHAYLAVGWREAIDTFVLLNSWSSGWGIWGYFYMKTADFAGLFSRQGEAVAAVEIA